MQACMASGVTRGHANALAGAGLLFASLGNTEPRMVATNTNTTVNLWRTAAKVWMESEHGNAHATATTMVVLGVRAACLTRARHNVRPQAARTIHRLRPAHLGGLP